MLGDWGSRWIVLAQHTKEDEQWASLVCDMDRFRLHEWADAEFFQQMWEQFFSHEELVGRQLVFSEEEILALQLVAEVAQDEDAVWLFIQPMTHHLVFYLDNGSIMEKIDLRTNPERIVDWLELHGVISEAKE
jgi:hypothetical protein